jgi:ATP-dependent DNA helicase RecG
VVVSGELGAGLERQMLNPMFEVLEGEVEDLLHTGRLIPVHGLTRGVTARGMRQAVHRALEAVADRIEDAIPADVAAAQSLPPLATALRDIHFPPDATALEAARARLAWEELFQMQMVMELRRRVLQEEGRALALDGPGTLARDGARLAAVHAHRGPGRGTARHHRGRRAAAAHASPRRRRRRQR